MQQIKSFRRVRRATFVLLVVCAMTITGLLGYSFVHEQETARKYQDISASIVTTVVDQQLRETAAALATLEGLDRNRDNLSQTELQAQIASTKSLVSGIDNLLLFDANGTVTGATVDKLVGGNFAFRDYFQAAIEAPKGQLILSPPFQSSLDNNWKFTLSRALYAANGELSGVAAASFDTSLLTRLIGLQLGDESNHGASVILIHAGGMPILRVPLNTGFTRENLILPDSPLSAHIASGQLQSLTEGRISSQGSEALLDLRTVAPTGLYLNAPLIVVSAYAKNAAYSEWQLLSLLVIGAYLLLALGIIFLLRNEESHLIHERDIRQKLETQSRRLSSIIEGTNVGTWEWNVQTGEVVFNERWAEIIGYRLDDLGPLSIETWMSYAHPEDLDKSGQLLERHFRGELPYYECEARMRHKNGQWIWVLDRGKVAVWTEDGKPLWMYGTHQEITERKLAEEHTSQLAYFDSLTELPNRRLLHERLDQALIQARRNERTLALMFLDLDNFKPVNDNYGHQMGDRLLVEVAARLRGCVRASDTVGRTGGDEFVILLPEIADAEDAEKVAQKILATLQQPIALSETINVQTPPSIGISICINGANDGPSLMEQADQAMYAAKRAGRNCYRLYQPVEATSSLTGKTLPGRLA
ncbi:diguanylate cyclase domain-containing protein [Marinobacterium sp. YM272]|uniref:diguanylate cyclase domain-containing protein n=1 Tax=Marinobacterium sp. YM272 TaxID=3421654 RepID=UPI003D7F33AB